MGLWAFLIGALLIAVALLDEPRERKIHTWLEHTWIRLDERSQAAISKNTQVLRRIAATLGAILDRIFGPKLVSARSIAVSATLCLGIILATIALFVDFIIPLVPLSTLQGNTLTETQANNVLTAIQSALDYFTFFVFVFALLPALLEKRFVGGWVGCALFFWVITLSHCATYQTTNGTAVTPYVFAICIGIASDVIFIGVARRLFRTMENTTSTWRVVVAEIEGLVLAIALVAVPVVPMILVIKAGGTPKGQHGGLLVALGYAALTNLPDEFFMLLPVGMVLAYLVHRTAWPTIKAPSRYAFAASLTAIAATCHGTESACSTPISRRIHDASSDSDRELLEA